MFTFSFGSAFAAGVSNYDSGLATTHFTKAMEAVEKGDGYITLTQQTLAWNNTTYIPTTYSYKIDYSTLKANEDAILKAVLEYDKNTATTGSESYVGNTTNGGKTLEEFLNRHTVEADGGNHKITRTYGENDLMKTLVAYQFNADKEKAISILNGLSLAEYSTAALPEADDDGCTTYAEHIQYVIKTSVSEINTIAADLNSDSTFINYAQAKYGSNGVAANKYIDYYFNDYADESGSDLNSESSTAIAQELGYLDSSSGEEYIGIGVYELNGKYHIKGTTDLETWKTTAIDADKASDSAQRQALKATAAYQYSQYVALNTSSEAVANAKKALDAVNYSIDNVATIASAITFEGLVVNNDVAVGNEIERTFLDNYNKAADFETFANRYAAEKDATGALVRDAEEVAKIVKAAKLAAYQDSTGWTSASTYSDDVSYEQAVKDLSVSGEAAELAYAIKHYEALADKYVADAKADDTYYAKELAEVEALVAEFKTKAEALTKTAKVATLYEEYFNDDGASGKVDKVEKKAAAVTDTDITKLLTTAQAYRGIYNDAITGTDNKHTTNENILKAKLKKMVGDEGARTSTEIAALGTKIPELVQALPTNGAVDTAKDAADDAVTAAKYTDQASIDAAIKAVEEYEDLTGLDYERATLNGKILSMAYAQNNTLNAEYTAAAKTDKAALNAIQDKIDAFVDTYEYGTAVKAVFVTLSGKISTDLGKIKLDEAKAVAAKINALPINITEADKAAVEAARKAYNDFVAEYTDYEVETSAEAYLKTTGGVDLSALASAEAVLGLNDNSDADAKAYVQDLKIKARSVKTSKGVKVTINADVQSLLDGGFTVEYKFYRSTKSNKNFGTAKIVKTENTYLNTSGTKGTKYYYKAKLVVKNAKGEVVATTPLTQCLYASRTF